MVNKTTQDDEEPKENVEIKLPSQIIVRKNSFRIRSEPSFDIGTGISHSISNINFILT